MKKRLGILVVMFCLPLCAIGQDPTSFSHSSYSFISEVEDYFLLTPNKVYQDNAMELMQEFGRAWGNFTGDQQSEIMDFCDNMLAKHIKPFPVFYNYFSTLNALYVAEASEESIDSWLNCTKYIFEKKQRRIFTQHIEFSYDFFSRGVLNKTGGARWHLRNGVYELVGDTSFLVRIMSGDLVCNTTQDSAEIFNTYGTFDATNNLFTGHQGRVDWQRYHMDPLTVFATLNNFTIDVKQSEYKADSVVYYNKLLFDKPLHGILRDKPGTIAPNNRTDYPQFTSYEVRDIEEYYQNINYHGHVFVTGSNFNVVGLDDEKATLTIVKRGRRVLELQSMMFKMYEGKVVSDKVSLHVFLDNDTIRHPYLGLRYEEAKRKMMLYFPRTDLSKLPFTDTYHGVNIYFDAFNWNIDSNEASFQQMESQTTDSHGYFASLNYFRKNEFDKIKGIDASHPIYRVAKYLYDYSTDQVEIEDYAAYAQKSVGQCVSLFNSLSAMGYMEYDPDTRTGKVTPLFYKAIKARNGSTDYDIIKISSYTQNRTPNMVLNMKTYDITVNGVQPIVLSDVKQVNMVPDSGQIVLKSNRNFVFAGKVNAGLFEFYSHVNSFNYDEFRLDLPDIDSISFYVNRNSSLDQNQQSLVRVKNVISDLSGILIIDDKKNRSGSMQYPEYPKFICNQESYVYFDKKSINEGKLSRDRFQYIVEPFEIDSLMTFTTDGLHFPGRLVSPIFPDIHQELGVMSDYSLGFENVSGPKGYPIYGGKGTYYNTIHLSNRGFYGSGKIKYCNAVYSSERHKFYFDAVSAKTTDFVMEKRVKGETFPEAKGDVMRFRWYVPEAYVELNTIQTPIRMYGKTDFYGKAIITPKDIKGSGKLNYDNSSLTSETFAFDHSSLLAESSNFVLTSGADSVFLASNYKTSMNFEKNKSVFNYLDETSRLQFPMNMFACTLDEAEWDMSQRVISISNRDKTYEKQLVDTDKHHLIDVEFDGSRFISLHPDHDSLAFYCLNADYNLDDYSVNCRDVKIIKIGNVAVFPGDGMVSIGQSAYIKPLENATIIGDVVDRRYTFTQANVNIFGKNNYNANGWCNYVTAAGVPIPIYFSSIEPIEGGRTRAVAQIAEKDIFLLNPYFSFAGNVIINMDESLMHFNGRYKLIHNCITGLPWLAADTIIDPADVRIPIMLGDRNPNIANGLYYDKYTERFFASLLSPIRPDMDIDTINHTQGSLFYDKENNSYKVEGTDAKGYSSVVQLIPENCTVMGEGNMEIGSHHAFVDVTCNGIYKYNIASDSIAFNVAMAVKMPFDMSLSHYMADSLADSDFGSLELDRTTYLNIVKSKVTSKNEFERVEREVEQYGHPRRMPSIFDESLVLADVDLVWNEEENSYLSVGKIGVASVHRNQVNMYVDGYMEIHKGRVSDVISIYLKPLDGTWFFIHYENNVLQLMSSSKAFNRRIVGIKEKARQFEDRKAGEKYEYVISTIMKVNNFVNRMRVLNGEDVEEEDGNNY